MAEVKHSKKKKTKKSSKKLNKNAFLTNDELLDQILNKKSRKHLVNKKKISDTDGDKVESKNTKGTSSNDAASNLIITREISFDKEFVNLKDKKILKELKEAIENYDKLDNSALEIHDDIELLPSVKYANYKLKRNLVICLTVLLIIICLILFVLNI